MLGSNVVHCTFKSGLQQASKISQKHNALPFYIWCCLLPLQHQLTLLLGKTSLNKPWIYPWVDWWMCGSKKYPYLPHGRDFSLDPPPLWKFQSSFIHNLLINFWAFENPPPPRNFHSLLWESMDIFWNYKIKKNNL